MGIEVEKETGKPLLVYVPLVDHCGFVELTLEDAEELWAKLSAFIASTTPDIWEVERHADGSHHLTPQSLRAVTERFSERQEDFYSELTEAGADRVYISAPKPTAN